MMILVIINLNLKDCKKLAILTQYSSSEEYFCRLWLFLMT